MASKNFSFRLLLPVELHNTYKRVVNDKAKQNAFISHLREVFAKLLADAVISQGGMQGNISKAHEELSGNITSTNDVNGDSSLNKDSFTDKVITGNPTSNETSLIGEQDA